MFSKMRRKDKLINQEGTVKILQDGSFGTLATVGENGYPYATPLNYAYQDGVIYFHCAPTGHKLANISFQDKVSFSVVTYERLLPDKFSTEFDSAIVFGQATAVTEEVEKKQALQLLIEKYSPDYIEQGNTYIAKSAINTAIYKIQIEHMTGKQSR